MDEQQLSPASTPTGRLSSQRWLGILAVVAFLLLLGVGYLWWHNRSPQAAVTNQPTAQTNTVTNSTVAPVAAAPRKITVNAKPDADGDGLTDDEEKTAGTKIDLVDTDLDNLTDYEEVKIYRTNPLLPDSDKDGYLDGNEVRNGMNPSGPGTLRDLKQAIEQLKKN